METKQRGNANVGNFCKKAAKKKKKKKKGGRKVGDQ